ncbi:hypothetical protein D3C75_353470 [compost metagenome]
MIYVDKNTIAEPDILRNNNADPNGEKQTAINHFEENIGDKVEFRIFGTSAVRSALKQLFHNKCAYCESVITHISYPHVEHWRPKGCVAGQANHNGYYWLASEWSNLLLACSVCNGQAYKGNHFPISRGSNYAYRSTENLGDEQPLLINPCEETNPSRHFLYQKRGGMRGTTAKGRKSIAIYGLNRQDLLLERRKIAKVVQGYLDDIGYHVDELREAVAIGKDQAARLIFKKRATEKVKSLRRYCDSDFQYSAMTRQMIQVYRQDRIHDKDFMAATRSLI